jgi:hypothetical protein
MQFSSKRAVACLAIESLESRRLLTGTTTQLLSEPITIGTPSLKDITFVASSGRETTITVHSATAAIDFTSAPTAALTLYKGHAFFPAGAVETVGSIAIANAMPGKSTLSVVCAYGPGLFNVGSITGGDLGSVKAPDVNLTGSMTVTSVKSLVLGEVSGAVMSLGSSAGSVSIRGVLTGSLTAGSIGSLTTYEMVQAKVTTTDPFSRSQLQIGLIDGGEGIEQSTITSAGNIGKVKSQFIENSVISAAATLTHAATGHYPSAFAPQSNTAFTSDAFIGAVVIPSATAKGFFGNSVITAEVIRSVQLGQLNGGQGIAAERISSFSATGPSGQLDQFHFHLGAAQLSTVDRIQAALTRLNIHFTPSTSAPDDTVFYNFELNLLR